jgi:nucleotide-binding universal stress UspA family protein
MSSGCILVAIDDSDAATGALDAAARMARTCATPVRVVHVLMPPLGGHGFETPAVYLRDMLPRARREAGALLQRACESLAARGVKAQPCLLEDRVGRVCDAILAEADACGAEFIVMGTQGRSGMQRLVLGSQAEQVARLSPVPVLLARAHMNGASPEPRASQQT